MTHLLAIALSENGYRVLNDTYFDTLTVKSDIPRPALGSGVARAMVYLGQNDTITLSLNETTTIEKLEEIASLLCGKNISMVFLCH
jgi:glycine dehydrogenase